MFELSCFLLLLMFYDETHRRLNTLQLHAQKKRKKEKKRVFRGSHARKNRDGRDKSVVAPPGLTSNRRTSTIIRGRDI